MKTAKTIFLWVVGIMFIITGTLKLAHMDDMSTKIFGVAHYPIWLYYIVAVFELSGGVLLLMKKTRLLGAALIVVIMMGAIFTHMYIHDSYAHDIVPTLIIAFLGTMSLGNRSREEFVPAAHGRREH